MYSVYVTIRDDGAITAINSSAFIADVTGWTKIDEKCSWKNNSETYTDSIYTKDFPAGVAEIPAHNGKLGNSFGIPNAVVVRYK